LPHCILFYKYADSHAHQKLIYYGN
jgi:hypothetical protein